MASPNPMRELLRQELGIDAFDGDETVLIEAWSDRPRPKERPRTPRGAPRFELVGMKAR